MNPNERAVLTKLLGLRHPTAPQTNRFGLRKATMVDFTAAVESRGQAASPPKKTGTLQGFGDDLKPVMSDDAGGTFVEWTTGPGERPILYLGREGHLEVAAMNARELFGTLARTSGEGWDVRDAMTVASWELTELDTVKPTRNLADLVDGEPATVDEEVVAVLLAHDVPVVDDVLASVRAATSRYLWSFIDRLDLIVTGYKLQRVWLEAWNRDPDVTTARAFSPKERFAVGERVSYAWNSSASGPQRAVVIAHPQPSRVLLADRSTAYLRAYT